MRKILDWLKEKGYDNYQKLDRKGKVFGVDGTFLGYFCGYAISQNKVGIVVSTKPKGKGKVFIPKEETSQQDLYYPENYGEMVKEGVHILAMDGQGNSRPNIYYQEVIEEREKPEEENKRMKNGGKKNTEEEDTEEESKEEVPPRMKRTILAEKKIGKLKDKLEKARIDSNLAKKALIRKNSEISTWKKNWVFANSMANSSLSALKSMVEGYSEQLEEILKVLPEREKYLLVAEKLEARLEALTESHQKIKKKLKKALPKDEREILLSEIEGEFRKFKNIMKQLER